MGSHPLPARSSAGGILGFHTAGVPRTGERGVEGERREEELPAAAPVPEVTPRLGWDEAKLITLPAPL